MGMLLSTVKGLINGSVYIDSQTMCRFIFLMGFLFLIIYGINLILRKKILNKFNNYFFLAIYILMLIFIFIRGLNRYIGQVNLVPFKSIIIFAYNFISLSDTISFFDFFKFVIVNGTYLIPVYICIYKKFFGKYLLLIFMISLAIEILKYIMYKNFNIDNIIISLISAEFIYDFLRYYTLKLSKLRSIL